MPAIVAGILFMARGTYLADHNGSELNHFRIESGRD
jgi:hypothetical protein